MQNAIEECGTNGGLGTGVFRHWQVTIDSKTVSGSSLTDKIIVSASWREYAVERALDKFLEIHKKERGKIASFKVVKVVPGKCAEVKA